MSKEKNHNRNVAVHPGLFDACLNCHSSIFYFLLSTSVGPDLLKCQSILSSCSVTSAHVSQEIAKASQTLRYVLSKPTVQGYLFLK